jgi:hypothetical protein
LAAVIFVALDPATRFADARDAVRQNDTQELLSAIKLHQVDNAGDYPETDDTSNQPLGSGTYMITASGAATGCDTDSQGNAFTGCTTPSDPSHCIDLTILEGSYMDSLPVNPNGDNEWNSDQTGYVYQQSGDIVTIASCDGESSSSISATR